MSKHFAATYQLIVDDYVNKNMQDVVLCNIYM